MFRKIIISSQHFLAAVDWKLHPICDCLLQKKSSELERERDREKIGRETGERVCVRERAVREKYEI